MDATTININDYGALLICAGSFVTNDRFILEHRQTRERTGCRVTRMPRETAGENEVAVEFGHPATGFWRITFPPTDWKAIE